MAPFSKENCLLFWNIITIPPVCKNVWRTRNYKGPNRKELFLLGEHFFTQVIPQAPPRAIPCLHKYLLRQRDGGLHQPAQQCGGLWGKAASEKKAQHGKKKFPILFCVLIWTQEVCHKINPEGGKRNANNIKDSTWLKVSGKENALQINYWRSCKSF